MDEVEQHQDPHPIKDKTLRALLGLLCLIVPPYVSLCIMFPLLGWLTLAAILFVLGCIALANA